MKIEIRNEFEGLLALLVICCFLALIIGLEQGEWDPLISIGITTISLGAPYALFKVL